MIVEPFQVAEVIAALPSGRAAVKRSSAASLSADPSSATTRTRYAEFSFNPPTKVERAAAAGEPERHAVSAAPSSRQRTRQPLHPHAASGASQAIRKVTPVPPNQRWSIRSPDGPALRSVSNAPRKSDVRPPLATPLPRASNPRTRTTYAVPERSPEISNRRAVPATSRTVHSAPARSRQLTKNRSTSAPSHSHPTTSRPTPASTSPTPSSCPPTTPQPTPTSTPTAATAIHIRLMTPLRSRQRAKREAPGWPSIGETLPRPIKKLVANARTYPDVAAYIYLSANASV